MQSDSISPSGAFTAKEMWQIKSHLFVFSSYASEFTTESRKNMLTYERPHVQYLVSHTNLTERLIVRLGPAYTGIEVIIGLVTLIVVGGKYFDLESLDGDIRTIVFLCLFALVWHLLFYGPIAFLTVFILCKLGVITRRGY